MVILNTQSWFLLLHNVPSGHFVNKLCNTIKILMEQNAKMIGTEQNQTISEHLHAWERERERYFKSVLMDIRKCQNFLVLATST